MTESTRLAHKSKTIGDAAVDGLFSGVLAGVLMAAYLVVVGLVVGEGPGTVLGRFAGGEVTTPLVGALSHLAVSAVYGALFGAGWHLIARRWPFTSTLRQVQNTTGLSASDRLRAGSLLTWMGGLAYGVVLLVLAEVVILPRTASPLQEIPLVHWAVAHGIYGLTLGVLIHRGREA